MNINISRKTVAAAFLVSAMALPVPAFAQDDALACATQHGLTSEHSTRVGDLTFTNSSDAYIQIFRVDPDGSSMEMTSLEAGQTSKLTQNREAVYVGLDAQGNCMGAGKLRESRATITFGG